MKFIDCKKDRLVKKSLGGLTRLINVFPDFMNKILCSICFHNLEQKMDAQDFSILKVSKVTIKKYQLILKGWKNLKGVVRNLNYSLFCE